MAHTLGWIGTGRMGAEMAGRLIKAGNDVTVQNRTRSKAEAVSSLVVDTPPTSVTATSSSLWSRPMTT